MNTIRLPEIYYRREDTGPQQMQRMVEIKVPDEVQGQVGTLRYRHGGHVSAGGVWELHHNDGRTIRVSSSQAKNFQAIADGEIEAVYVPEQKHPFTGEKFAGYWKI